MTPLPSDKERVLRVVGEQWDVIIGSMLGMVWGCTSSSQAARDITWEELADLEKLLPEKAQFFDGEVTRGDFRKYARAAMAKCLEILDQGAPQQ